MRISFLTPIFHYFPCVLYHPRWFHFFPKICLADRDRHTDFFLHIFNEFEHVSTDILLSNWKVKIMILTSCSKPSASAILRTLKLHTQRSYTKIICTATKLTPEIRHTLAVCKDVCKGHQTKPRWGDSRRFQRNFVTYYISWREARFLGQSIKLTST